MKMKGKLMSTMLVALMAISLLSCKDDDDKKPANQFTIDNSAKSLKTGAIFLDQTGDGGTGQAQVYYHEITLLSDGLSVNGKDLAGKGNAVSFVVLGASKTTLEAGTYNFNDDEATEKNMDFVGGAVVLDYDVTASTGTVYEDFSAGKITVAKSGTDNYTIDFDGTVNGKPVKAHMTGKFSIILD